MRLLPCSRVNHVTKTNREETHMYIHVYRSKAFHIARWLLGAYNCSDFKPSFELGHLLVEIYGMHNFYANEIKYLRMSSPTEGHTPSTPLQSFKVPLWFHAVVQTFWVLLKHLAVYWLILSTNKKRWILQTDRKDPRNRPSECYFHLIYQTCKSSVALIFLFDQFICRKVRNYEFPL